MIRAGIYIRKSKLDKVELTFSFPVDGEYTHLYPLPGKPATELRPHSSTDQRACNCYEKAKKEAQVILSYDPGTGAILGLTGSYDA